MRRFLIFVATLAILPAMVLAQGRGGGHGMASGMGHSAMGRPAMGRSVMAAPSFAMRSSPPVGSRFAYANRVFPASRYFRTRSGALVARSSFRGANSIETARSGRRLLSQDVVPGLGFDYSHVAAVRPQGSFGRGRGRGRNRGYIGAYFPFYGGAYYWPFYDDDFDDEEAAAPPPQEAPEVYNEEPEQTESAENEPYVLPSQDYVPGRPAAPQDTDQYVFVRRDGTLFFAVAYSWENGTLHYVTSQGIGRTAPESTLDLNATQKFNQQRGLNFSLPA